MIDRTNEVYTYMLKQKHAEAVQAAGSGMVFEAIIDGLSVIAVKAGDTDGAAEKTYIGISSLLNSRTAVLVHGTISGGLTMESEDPLNEDFPLTLNFHDGYAKLSYHFSGTKW